jgi:hypothetical protein
LKVEKYKPEKIFSGKPVKEKEERKERERERKKN